MMNAELVTAHEQRIIIPTVYRGDYLAALKAIINRTSPEPIIRMLDYVQRFTQSINWTDFKKAEDELERANAFLDSAEADDRGLRLRIPEKVE